MMKELRIIKNDNNFVLSRFETKASGGEIVEISPQLVSPDCLKLSKYV